MPHENVPLREKLWRNGYWYIEIKPKHWVIKARWIIQQAANCKLAPRAEVHYKDNNKNNCTIDNLIVKDFAKKIEWWLDENCNIITRGTPLWSRKHESCISCHNTNRKHSSGGLCETCYRSFKLSKFWHNNNVDEFVTSLSS